MSSFDDLDPATAEALVAILATAPPDYLEWRRSRLEDPQYQDWREDQPDRLASYFDPEEIKAQLKWREEGLDPYSERSLRRKQFIEACEAGGHVVVTEIETGEVVDEWDKPAKPGGGASRN